MSPVGRHPVLVGGTVGLFISLLLPRRFDEGNPDAAITKSAADYHWVSPQTAP